VERLAARLNGVSTVNGKKFVRFFDHILDISVVLATIMTIAAMLLVCTEITMRYFMGQPLMWVIDVCTILLVYITFLGSAWLLRADGHVRMELVINRLSKRQGAIVNTITSGISVIVFMVLTWYGAKFTWHFAQIGHFLPTNLEPPTYLILLVIPIGSFLLFMQSIRTTVGYVRSVSLLPDSKTKRPLGPEIPGRL